MSLFADIILAILAVIIVVRCTKMGCFKAVTNLIKLAATILLTAIFGKNISNILYEKLFYPKVSSLVSKEINSIAEGANNNISEMLTNVSEKFQKLLNTAGVSLEKLRDTYMGAEDIDAATAGITHDISSPCARLFSNIVGYLALFVVIIVILTVLFFLLNKAIIKIPVIKTCNKILGLVFGIACAFLALCICSYVFTGLFSLLKLNSETIVNDAIIYKMFYKLDILNLLK